MHVVRLIVVVFLIVTIVFTYSPQGRTEMSQAWQNVRPAVLQFTDGLYAAVRDVIAGIDSEHNGVDDQAPGVNFDEVITRQHAILF